MAFTEKELDIIKVGVQAGKSRSEVEAAVDNYRNGIVPQAQKAPEPSFFSRVGSELKSAFTGLQDTTTRGANLMQEGKPVQGAVMSGLGAAGGVIRGAVSPITAAVMPLIEKSGIADNTKVQEIVRDVETWAKANPDLATNTKNVVEIATTLIGVKGVTSAAKPIKEGVEAGMQGAKEGISTAIETGKRVAEPVIKMGEDATQGIRRIPANIATNAAERQAAFQAIKELPSETAQIAARDGVAVDDLKVLYQIPETIKPQARELADTVSSFARKETNIDPIEIVGKPIVSRIKELDNQASEVGQKLGVVANNLGTVTSKEMSQPVFFALQRVAGLTGLKVSPRGILDFTDTTLKTNATAQKEIQRMYLEAVSTGTGKQKHLLRQELFEILGGKKKSLTNLTDTEEKALDAIRKGISDVLESKNADYKTLSKDYARLANPLRDLRKAIKDPNTGVEDDILNMNAGLIARRLTSTSVSQGQIRNILNAIDNATDVKGNLLDSTEGLQTLYNILGKYYDIAPATGFKGEITSAVGKGLGVGNRILNAMSRVVGETPAVRQKALESVLRELLGESKTLKSPLQKTPTPTNPQVKSQQSPSPNSTTIPKELQPLANEARKYKSAEDFVLNMQSIDRKNGELYQWMLDYRKKGGKDINLTDFYNKVTKK